MAITQPDFSNIFASGSAIGEVLNWPTEDYLRGWGYLDENEPPSMEFFNRLAQISDQKDKYLFDTLSVWQAGKEYNLYDVVYSPSLDSRYQLVCVKAGTSSSTEPSWIQTEYTITADNTCSWIIVQRAVKQVVVSKKEITSLPAGSIWVDTNV